MYRHAGNCLVVHMMAKVYPAAMIASLTLACDWPGCRERLTYDFRLLQPDPKHGWKTEPNMDAYACHLCPAHKRKSWEEVKAAKAKAGTVQHSTPG